MSAEGFDVLAVVHFVREHAETLREEQVWCPGCAVLGPDLLVEYKRTNHERLFAARDFAPKVGITPAALMARVERFRRHKIGPRTVRFDHAGIVAVFDSIHSPQVVRTLAGGNDTCSPERTASSVDGFVYVIEAVGSDRAKVGWTRAGVEERLRTLQTSSPFELAVRLSVSGSRVLEFACHRALQSVRVSSTTEWFHGVEEVVMVVNRMHGCILGGRGWQGFPCEAPS